MSLSAVDLQEAIDRLALAPPCPKHGRVHLVICRHCLQDVRCQACATPSACPCQGDWPRAVATFERRLF